MSAFAPRKDVLSQSERRRNGHNCYDVSLQGGFAMQHSTIEVARLVEIRLQETAHSALALVTCEFDDGVMTLRGEVPSFYLKQLAQTIARRTQGVNHVVNHICVPAYKE
jgi:osmotically-inducible protein OsmY